jgi:hypothetical protein
MRRRPAEGTKYRATESLPLVDVAKLIRADIKEAIRAGMLPAGLTTSVRVRHHSSIDIAVTAAPFEVLSRAHLLVHEVLPHVHAPRISRYTPLTLCALERLEDIADAYNFDRSEIESDYFNVRFYGHPSVSYLLEAQARAALKAELADTIADVSVEYAHAKATMPPGEASTSIADGIAFRFHPHGVGNNESEHALVAASHGRSWAQLVAQYAPPPPPPACFVSSLAALEVELAEARRLNAELRRRHGLAVHAD